MVAVEKERRKRKVCIEHFKDDIVKEFLCYAPKMFMFWPLGVL